MQFPVIINKLGYKGKRTALLIPLSRHYSKVLINNICTILSIYLDLLFHKRTLENKKNLLADKDFIFLICISLTFGNIELKDSSLLFRPVEC